MEENVSPDDQAKDKFSSGVSGETEGSAEISAVEPVALTEVEYRTLSDCDDPEAPEVAALMQAKGLEFGGYAKVTIGAETNYPSTRWMSLDKDDFGTILSRRGELKNGLANS